jgi:hypothetical protein
MGVDKYLYYKGECVANLGRAYHYAEPPSAQILERLKLRLYTTRDPDEFIDLLETIMEEHEAKARSEVINQILEDGALTVKDE